VSRREEIAWSKGADLTVPKERFGDILAAAADIVIAVDPDGVVQSILTNQGDQNLGCLDHWVGRDLREFLTDECHPKLDAALAGASMGAIAVPRSVELNHIDNASWEFPIRYSVFDTGEGGPILMVGRDLRPVAEVQQQLVRTQLELEKDYEAQREAETRFRVLMGETRDALVFVDAKSGRIEDISEAAGVMLGVGTESLTGGSFFQEFEDRRRAEFIDSLNAAAGNGAAPMVATSRRNRTPLKIHSTLFRAAGRVILLCRLEADVRSETVGEELGVNLRALYDRGFDAVVFTDSRGGIRGANEAFLNLLDVPSVAALAGKSISEFLVRGSVDLRILIDGAARSGRVRQFSTRLETVFGSQRPVDVSVTNLNERVDPTFGFVLRDTSRGETASVPMPADGDVTRNVMDLVGASPLKDIVAATTDVIEKMCIETAVDLTRNNRVAAAEMLGLSRQSLYVKLRKYNLLSKTGQD
jgi:transcriptional regulator PpsR